MSGAGSGSPVNIGDFPSSQIPIPSMNLATLDVCSRKVDGTITNEKGFNGDILNFLWYKGSESLYVNASGNIDNTLSQ